MVQSTQTQPPLLGSPSVVQTTGDALFQFDTAGGPNDAWAHGGLAATGGRSTTDASPGAQENSNLM
jgi:hypothetical protein